MYLYLNKSFPRFPEKVIYPSAAAKCQAGGKSAIALDCLTEKRIEEFGAVARILDPRSIGLRGDRGSKKRWSKIGNRNKRNVHNPIVRRHQYGGWGGSIMTLQYRRKTAI